MGTTKEKTSIKPESKPKQEVLLSKNPFENMPEGSKHEKTQNNQPPKTPPQLNTKETNVLPVKLDKESKDTSSE